MRRLLLTTILASAATNASAVSIEEALTSGYNHNEELKTIRNEFLDEVERFPRALANFMPRVSASFDSTNSKLTEKSGRVNASNDTFSTDNLRYSRSITLEQPIFDGGSSVAELKAAQAAFRSSRGNYYAKEQDVIVKEITTYLDCVEAKEKYEISKVSVRSNKTQLEAMREKFKLGESTETEVASAREGLATAEANQAFAYANYEAAKSNFIRVFGIEAVDIKMPEAPGELPKSLAELIDLAVNKNPNVTSAMHKTQASKAAEYAPKGALLPKVAFKVTNTRTDFKPENFATSTSNVNNRSITSTLSVNVPILSRGGTEYSDIRRAKYQTRRDAINHDNILKQVKSNSQATWSELEANKSRIKAAAQAVKAAEIAYDGMVQEEMLGSKTIVDVLRAEERLNKARETRVEARKALVLSAYRMKALVGDLTAKSLKLKVNYFEPEVEFKKVKMKVVGF